MNSFFEAITFVIVSYKSENIIAKCIKNIPKKSKIIIIENSKNKNILKNIKKRKNIKLVLNENNGYGNGNNLGLTLTRTKYAFILNPDAHLGKETLKWVFKATKILKNEFSIIGPLNTGYKKKFITSEEAVGGHAMFLNLRKFRSRKIFDSKIFLFNEEIDLCLRLKNKGKKIYSVSNCDISHKGNGSVEKNFKVDVLRNWHGYWSYFYFQKKHFGKFKAYLNCSKKFFGSLHQYIFALILFKHKKKYMNRHKFSGLLNSFLGKPSWLRLEDLKGDF
tara:strand:- start:117 stop:947 length:831 start_codon:yes stop_codon:yes gene_type:complete